MGTTKRQRQRAGRQERAVAEMTAARRAQARRRAVKVGVAVVAVLVALFIFSLVSGGGGDDDTADLAEDVLSRDPPDPEPPSADLPAGSLEISTLIEGEGDGAAAGDTVVVHYIGKTPDGEVFDQSWERGEPFEVENLGQAGVIDGWNEGLIGARVGDRLRLEIGVDLAYGEGEGHPLSGEPLVFEIDVVDIARGGS